MNKIIFDDKRARSYKKKVEVLAFRSKDPFCFIKSWGKQDIRADGWVIVPLTEDGNPTGDAYGCDADVFQSTYEKSPSLRPNRYRKKETIRAYQPGNEFEVDTVLPDGHVEVVGSKAGSYDTWIVQAPGGEIYPIENKEFCRTYVEVIEKGETYKIKDRDEHWVADGTPKRILALDGGGVRGIVTLEYLEKIETLLQERHGNSDEFRLCHYFDLIAGTSTGAIIAAALAKGMTVKEVRTLYMSLAGSIFKPLLFRKGLLRAKFSAKALQSSLKDVFANNTMGSKSIKTGLLIVAKRLDTGSVWPMSNNPNNPYWIAGKNDNFLSNEDYPLRAVVRASTAAPSYFSPEKIEISKEGDRPHGEFVDGGVSPHNNPALLALQLATLNGFGAEWPMDPDKLLLISVGTGSAPTGTSKSWFAASHAIKALRSLMDDCAESVETILQWLSSSPTARSIDAVVGDLSSDLLAERPLIQYSRYNVLLESDWLKESLGSVYSEDVVESLREMDRPQNMELLSEIGKKARELQVKNEHFPPEFDLGL